MPEEEHGECGVVADVDAGAAACGVGVPDGAWDVVVAFPDGRGEWVPLVGSEDDVLEAGVGEGLDDGHAHAVVVDHGHGSGGVSMELPVESCAVGCGAAELLESEGLGDVTGDAAADAEVAVGDGAVEEVLGGLWAAVVGVVVPEPGSLAGEAVAVVGGSVGGLSDEFGGLVEEA